MGEYAKYAGREIKIGTCEDMYYLRASQRGAVERLPGSVNVNSDEVYGVRFRFPWPDEDTIEPGAFKDYDRAITAYGIPMPDHVEHHSVQFCASAGYNCSLPCPESKDGQWIRLIGADNQPKPITVHRNGFAGAV